MAVEDKRVAIEFPMNSNNRVYSFGYESGLYTNRAYGVCGRIRGSLIVK
jgi:hypothetical protein